MEHDTNALLWQGFFAITMFISTFVSYLLPIIIFTRRNRRIYEVNALGQEEDIHLPHHWSSLGQANVATQLKRIRLKRLLSNCNCISAGVFLGVCFLNLIPYVEEEFGKLIKDFDWLRNFFGTFPLGQFVTVCGLFMVLILESLLSKCFHSQPATVHTGQVVLPILHLDEELVRLDCFANPVINTLFRMILEAYTTIIITMNKSSFYVVNLKPRRIPISVVQAMTSVAT